MVKMVARQRPSSRRNEDFPLTTTNIDKNKNYNKNKAPVFLRSFVNACRAYWKGILAVFISIGIIVLLLLYYITPETITEFHAKDDKCGSYRLDKVDLSTDFSRTYSLEDFPFIVGLIATNGIASGLACHGVIISPTQIATTPHCHAPLEGSNIKEVYFYNVTAKSKTVIPFHDFQYIPHQKYKYGNFNENYDVAILQHSRLLTNYTACVEANSQLTNLKDMMLTMELVLDGSNYPTKLKVRKVSIVDNEECANAYKKLKVNLQFHENSTNNDQQMQMIYCVENGDDYTPQGISGTPLLGFDGLKFTVFGVCSLGGIQGQHAPDLYININMLRTMSAGFPSTLFT